MTDRPVGALSGGESFLASLALALGLSDVVLRRSGGLRLDALFVDEGFGSLDEETLDDAIRALEELRERGRLVGVISHVPELRRRIPARNSRSARPGRIRRVSCGPGEGDELGPARRENQASPWPLEGPATGSSTRNVAPAPSALSTSIRPPSAVMISRVIHNPRPNPP